MENPANAELLIENLVQAAAEYENNCDRLVAKTIRVQLEKAKQAIRDALVPTPAQPALETAPLRLCGYCKSWNSKPCGEGCCWSPTDPTIEKVRADDLKAKQKHNRKHPLPVTFER